MAKTKLQAARKRLGYSQNDVVKHVLTLSRIHNEPVATESSLHVQLSKWENGHQQVGEPYRRFFREIYGMTNEELGFTVDEIDEDTEHLRDLLAHARTVDAETVEMFRRQVDNARRLDRKHGGVLQLDPLRSQIEQIQDFLTFSTTNGQREPLAAVLAETAALAGWEALDRNALGQAWRLHETAKNAALAANSPDLYVHAMAQQAFILVDLGDPATAVEQLAAARETANPTATPLLRAWLAAAHGEGLAALGQRDASLQAFDDAHALLPTDPVGPALPFLFLAGAHLDRWRGDALAKLGEPEAVDQLTEALPRLPADFTRARANTLVDLAHAHATAGNRDAALDYSRQAKRTASQIKSDRLLRRLSGLVLPT